MNKSYNKKGFTLVEIMIVVVIIGLLAAMAIPAFNRVRGSSQANACVNNLRQIASAMDQYYLEEPGAIDLDGTSWVGALVGPDLYIRSTPTCPSGGDSYENFGAGSTPLCSVGEGTHTSVTTDERHKLPVN